VGGTIMGWCSGTGLFDEIFSVIVEIPNISTNEQVEIVKKIIREFERSDWDCQSDSMHFNIHPVYMRALGEVHPTWEL
jgi:hypothetical protein